MIMVELGGPVKRSVWVMLGRIQGIERAASWLSYVFVMVWLWLVLSS